MEKQYLSQKEVNPGPAFTRNHTIWEGSRFKRAIFKGQYCRSFGCCEDRDDGCATQFYEANAVCYCDKFCQRENSDCCPDYKSFCLEEKEWPPHTKPWDPEGRLWKCVWTSAWFITDLSNFLFLSSHLTFLPFLRGGEKWILWLNKCPWIVPVLCFRCKMPVLY